MHANALTRGLLVSALVATSSCAPAVEDKPAKEDPVVPEVCTYPTPTALEGVGSIIPPFGWNVAINSKGETTTLNLEDVYCRKAPYENIETIFFVLVAEWCQFCPGYSRQVGEIASGLEARNALVVFVDMERTDFTLPTTQEADVYVDHYTDTSWRVGEADGVVAGSIHSSAPIWPFLPGTFVVRTRDMKVIASRAENNNEELRLLDIAEDPEANWSRVFASKCVAGEEEAGEPNDVLAQATSLAPGELAGGICTDAPDFFTIDLAGSWSIDLAFSNAEGDLDVFVIDPATGDVLMDGEVPVGSATTEDTESFTHSGPATIVVVGYQGASANYTLTLTDLGAGTSP